MPLGASLSGLLIVWPLIVVLAILVKVKMPGGPEFFCQKRVCKDGKMEDEMIVATVLWKKVRFGGEET